MNLKHGRGPIPDDLRAAFRELCRQTPIDGLLQSIEALIEPLERSAVPDLEAVRRRIEALRRREVTRNGSATRAARIRRTSGQSVSPRAAG